MNSITKFLGRIPKFFKGLMKNKGMKYGTNSFLLTAVVIALVIVFNMALGLLNAKLDLTPNKLYSITDITNDVLAGLDKDVTIYGFFDEGAALAGGEYKEILELLNHYKSNPHIKLVIQDPDKNPSFIKEVDPDDIFKPVASDFIVKSGNKMKKLTYSDLFTSETDQSTFQTYKTGSNAEDSFTGAIKYVTSAKSPTVYFLEGHQELSLDSDYTNVKSYLEKNNYDVLPLQLLTVSEVPANAEMVVIASPKSDLTVNERNILETYLTGGGKALFMFDALPNGPTFEQLNKLLSKYNIAVNNDKIKENDEKRHVAEDPYTIMLDVPSSEVIPQDFNIILGNSRSIKLLSNAKEYIKVTSLATTSSSAIGEQVDPTAGEANQGPLDIAVAVEYTGGNNPVKILALGNATFISDSAQDIYGNYYANGMYLFLYSLSWLQGTTSENLIGPKPYVNNTITISATQAKVTGVAVVIILPLLILGAGTYVYMRRRHL